MKIINAIILAVIFSGIVFAGAYEVGRAITIEEFKALDFKKEGINMQCKPAIENKDLIYNCEFDDYEKGVDPDTKAAAMIVLKPSEKFTYNLKELYNPCIEKGFPKKECIRAIVDVASREMYGMHDTKITQLEEKQKEIDYSDELTAEDFAIIMPKLKVEEEPEPEPVPVEPVEEPV